MKHVYIDLGCSDGHSVQEFLNWKALGFPPEISWEIHAFDPQEHKQWTTIPARFYRKAAWIEDGQKEFSLLGDSSTLMEEKLGYPDGKKVTVETFDFSKWLTQFEDCYVILKMDIEGAELPVLTKMIEDGTDEIVNLALIEWHDGKMPAYPSNKHWIWENLKCEWADWR